MSIAVSYKQNRLLLGVIQVISTMSQFYNFKTLFGHNFASLFIVKPKEYDNEKINFMG